MRDRPPRNANFDKLSCLMQCHLFGQGGTQLGLDDTFAFFDFRWLIGNSLRGLHLLHIDPARRKRAWIRPRRERLAPPPPLPREGRKLHAIPLFTLIVLATKHYAPYGCL